ncbi:CRISPR-associated ring nuclease [Methylocaldum szegediense]|uniref:adenosine deaminase n=1 Tax=Methylocaldum szegediense TaxID=73780 RepID=A0ABN8WZP3_9GAMM|nr:CRISPR-associated ring nuclease [Methylocaldum szegediense]CAI8770815.1 adenosine deaminase [Methylocaldum szegediense]
MKTNILLCTLGASWAVIPEVYGFLSPDRLPLYRSHPQRADFERQRHEYRLEPPDEIWVCTTQGDKPEEGIAALLDWHARLEHPPMLRIWQAERTDQLASQTECERFREVLLRLCLLAHERAGDGQVVFSLAGGRKTMSADLQWAGSVLGCDALIHVVGQEPLPKLLREPTVEFFTRELPAEIVPAVVPLVAGVGRRSELLDVELDGRGVVSSRGFPLPLAEPGTPLPWAHTEGHSLRDEIRRREAAGSQLLGNYLRALGEAEHHENWRSLYRLPPRVIENLRRRPLDPGLADWLRALPKGDLHRHIGGCLGLDDQRTVGRAVWDTLTPSERGRALDHVAPLLEQTLWPSDWPRRWVTSDIPRPHWTAALLVHADTDRLIANLFDVTEPRVALKSRHPLGFAAYERPGELSGSAILSHPAAIDPYAACLVRQAQAEGLAYVELRGSPHKYGDGLLFLERLAAALQAAMASLPHDPRPVFRFILIADRRQHEKLSDVIDLAVRAKECLPDFVVGLDMAGDEAQALPPDAANAFARAFEICLPLTIHAGEGETAEQIWKAAYHFHADRIGHGLTIGDHAPLAQRFRDRSICLELCPSSNREVVGYRDPAYPETAECREYPLWKLWQAGLPLTLCTDNPGISRTTLTGEYLAAARMVGEEKFNCWDALAMIKQAFVHAFLPSQEKEILIKRVDDAIYRQVLKQFGV